MPLTVAPGRVEASLMEAGKAMANTVEIAGGRTARPGWIAPADAAAALAAVGGPIRALHAAHPRGEVALRRNEVVREALGGRTWFGGLANLTESRFSDVAVHIRFHDRDGRPVGAPLSARAARLAPGVVMHLQARLPAGAAGLRIHALRWTRGGRTVELGPARSLPFGAVED